MGMSVEVCGGVWECSETFGMCVGVCGSLLLGHNQADFAVVWSYGIVLHPNIMWACLWRSAGVCGGVLRHLGCVWGSSA